MSVGTTADPFAPLRGASQGELARLHARGACPDPADLVGSLDGTVLTGALALPGVRSLGTWRGKVVERRGSVTTGLNRLGAGPLEVRRFRFEARRERSWFGDREVVHLDHDRGGNPLWIRRFHDELVQVDDGLFLASSHHGRDRASVRLLAWFALARPVPGAGSGE